MATGIVIVLPVFRRFQTVDEGRAERFQYLFQQRYGDRSDGPEVRFRTAQ